MNEDAALENLLEAKEKWGNKYPNAIKNWEDNWDNIITLFSFPDYIRKIMYTTYTDIGIAPQMLLRA